jgi:hypothetical protein
VEGVRAHAQRRFAGCWIALVLTVTGEASAWLDSVEVISVGPTPSPAN